MKTQINSLINGSKNVVRIESDSKYLTAKPATSHNGYAGTNYNLRREVADKVFAENGDTMNIRFNGHEITLIRHSSMSGKTHSYSCTISEELVAPFINTDGRLRTYTLEINNDCTVWIIKNKRANENAMWRFSYAQYIDESYIEIL